MAPAAPPPAADSARPSSPEPGAPGGLRAGERAASSASGAAKSALRKEILQARAARFQGHDAAAHRERLGRDWGDHGLRLVAEHGLEPGIAAAFLPTVTEPVLDPLLERLTEAGWTVVVPISLPHRRLEWARWTPGTPVEHGPFGIREPLGPRRGAEAFAAASLRLVPALALDEHGVRLGYGGGYFDAALALAERHPAVTAGVVFAEEILPAGSVPAEAHDARLDLALTERGPVRLGGSAADARVVPGR